MIELALIAACTNGVAPATVEAVIAVESRGIALAVGANPPVALPQPATPEQASQLTENIVSRGYSADLGLMQVNTMHLKRFRLKPIDLFDPCTNIFVGTTILGEFYQRASRSGKSGHHALRAALSAYNTGSFTKGLENGYVKKIEERAGVSARTSEAEAANSPMRVNFSRPLNTDTGSDVSREGEHDSSAGDSDIPRPDRRSQ